MYMIYHNIIHIDADADKQREIAIAISDDVMFNNYTIPTLGTINFDKICPIPRSLPKSMTSTWRIDNWGTLCYAFGYSDKYLEEFNLDDIRFNTIGSVDTLAPVGNIHPIMKKLSSMFINVPFVYSYTTSKKPITGRCTYINGEISNHIHMTDKTITTDYMNTSISDDVIEELNSIHFRK